MVTVRSIVVGTLAVSLIAGAVPRMAGAEEAVAAVQASPNLRASIAAAAAQLAREKPQVVRASTERTAAAAAGQMAPGGGGGGKGMMIITLVTTVIGLGATYYMIKELQKQTEPPSQ